LRIEPTLISIVAAFAVIGVTAGAKRRPNTSVSDARKARTIGISISLAASRTTVTYIISL